MRALRVTAFLVWAAVASLAIAGFAAFSPPGEEVVEVTTNIAVQSSWGSVSGRVAAMAFATGLRVAYVPTTEAVVYELAVEEPVPTTSTTTTSSTTTTTTTTTTTVAAAPPPTRAPSSTTASTTTTTTSTTTTTTTQPPEPSPFPSAVERWRPLISYYFAESDVNLALSIVECESGGNPYALNEATSAAGLFQHLIFYWEERSAAAGWEGADVYDPEANIGVAAWLAYDGGGWNHWGTCL